MLHDYPCVVETVTLDELDRRILHALAIAGRTPLRRIATVLGCSERTLAQRYRRLRDAGMRVVAVPDRRRLGRADWLVRLRCAPDAAPRIAQALARREDTSWVALASGGTELTCMAHAESGSGSLLLEKLSRTPRIDAITAHCVLRDLAGAHGWPGRLGALEAEEIERLREPEPAEHRGLPERITATDQALLRALAVDGRTGYPTLSALTGTPESTLRRRLTELHRRGVFYYDVDIDPGWFDYDCTAVLWLTVAPGELDAVATALAGHIEVAYAAATSGAANIVAFTVYRDLDACYGYLAHRLGALPGVLTVETSLITRQIKGPGADLAP